MYVYVIQLYVVAVYVLVHVMCILFFQVHNFIIYIITFNMHMLIYRSSTACPLLQAVVVTNNSNSILMQQLPNYQPLGRQQQARKTYLYKLRYKLICV